MSDGYYSWKARRAALVAECERLGLPAVGSNGELSAAIYHAENPSVKVAEVEADGLASVRRGDRAAAARLVAGSSRGRWADEGGYANAREAFNDLYGEVD